MARLEREQIQALNRGLNDLYDSYRRIIEFINETARSGGFDPGAFAIELTEKQEREMSALMLDELSKIEEAVQELKTLLEDLENPDEETE